MIKYIIQAIFVLAVFFGYGLILAGILSTLK